MATKEKIQHVRTPKGKSPRQLAKRDANIKAAQERLAKLQEKQRAEQEARKAAVAKHLHESAYLAAALHGPATFILNRWLKGRPATFERVSRFFSERPHLPQPLEPQADTNKAA